MTAIRRGRVTVLSHDKSLAVPLDMVIRGEERVLGFVPWTTSACSDGRSLVVAVINGKGHMKSIVQYVGTE